MSNESGIRNPPAMPFLNEAQTPDGSGYSQACTGLAASIFDGEFVACQWRLGNDLFETCLDLTGSDAGAQKVQMAFGNHRNLHSKRTTSHDVKAKGQESRASTAMTTFCPPPGLPTPPGLSPINSNSYAGSDSEDAFDFSGFKFTSWGSDPEGADSSATSPLGLHQTWLMSDSPVAPPCPPCLPGFLGSNQKSSDSIFQKIELDGSTLLSTTETEQQDITSAWADQDHEKGTCKPCLYFTSGWCQKELECTFCHLQHDGKRIQKVRPSKRTRACLLRRKAAANRCRSPAGM